MSPARFFNTVISASLLLASCSAGVTGLATGRPLATIGLPPVYTPTRAARSTALPSPSPAPSETPLPQGPLAPGTLLTITEIDMFDASSGWGFGLAAGDRFARVLRTADGGAGWWDATPPKTAPPEEFGQDPIRPTHQRAVGFFSNRQTAWVVYDELPFHYATENPVVVWRTEDGGENWSPSEPLVIDTVGWVDPAPPANAFSSFYPTVLQFLEDGLTGWLLATTNNELGSLHCAQTVLFRTTDGGAIWRSISSPNCGEGTVVFADADTGWIAAAYEPGFGGPIAGFTEDGGHTWKDVGSLRAPASGIHPCSAGPCETYRPTRLSTGWIQLLGWISGQEYLADASRDLLAVYSSNDGGLTWRWALLPSSAEPDPSFSDDPSGADVFFLTERIGWVLDYPSGGLYRTLDSGDHWEQVKIVTWNGVLEFSGEIYGWAVAWGADSSTEQPFPPSPVENPNEYGLVRTFDGGGSWVLLQPRIIDARPGS